MNWSLNVLSIYIQFTKQLSYTNLSPERDVWIHKQDAIFFLQNIKTGYFILILFTPFQNCNMMISILTKDAGTTGGPLKEDTI